MKPNKETYRILVIDDHPIVAEGIIALDVYKRQLVHTHHRHAGYPVLRTRYQLGSYRCHCHWCGVAVNSDGTIVYVADTQNKVIRKLSIE